MKKILIIILSTFSICKCFSQSKEEKLKAISIIEGLSYNEEYVGVKFTTSCKINFDELSGKIEIIDVFTDNSNLTNTSKFVFYLEDLDLSTLTEEIRELPSGLFSPSVKLFAKEDTIELITIKENKKEFPFPVAENKFQKFLIFYPNLKGFTKPLAKKYIENVKILLGITN